MLTYEQISDNFLTAARDAGLDPYIIEHKIETRSCSREFRCVCVPRDLNPPHEIRVEIGFHWDCPMTAETIYDEFKPDPEDEEELELCYIELEIMYHFTLKGYDWLDEADRELNKLFGRIMKHENIPNTHCELVVDDKGGKAVLKAWAEYFWEVSYVEDTGEFAGICAEIYRVLKEMRKIPLLKSK